MLISSIAIGNTLRAMRGATCHYRQEALDKSIGACIINHAASIARLYFLMTSMFYAKW